MASVRWALAVVGVLGVSASGPLMASIAAPALAIAFWRNALATAVLVPVAAGSRRRELTRLDRRHARLLAVAGLTLAGHFACWITALQLTSVASATALVCLQAGFVVLIGRWYGARVSRGVLVGLAAAFAGVLVVSGVDVTVSTEALVGDLLALAGGIFGAVYTWTGAELRRTLSTTVYTTLCYGICALVLLVVCVGGGQALSGYATEDWVKLAAVALSAQLLGHSVFNHLLVTMGPTVVSLVLLLEVPGAALLAAVFLGQAPPAGVYAGLVLIVVGLGLVVSARRTPPPVELGVD
jgi:drug/metabolite transporter (DMT)-like permease